MKTESKILLGIYLFFAALVFILMTSCCPDPYAHCTKYQIGYGHNKPSDYEKNR